MPTNGGIIGPENLAGTTLSQAQKITTFTSSGTFQAQPFTTGVTYVIVAGGGSGAGPIVLSSSNAEWSRRLTATAPASRKAANKTERGAATISR